MGHGVLSWSGSGLGSPASIIERLIKSSDRLNLPRLPPPSIKNPPGTIRRPSGRGTSRAGFQALPDGCQVFGVAAATVFFIHSVVTLLGRSIGVPIARLMINCESMPIARETENSTV